VNETPQNVKGINSRNVRRERKNTWAISTGNPEQPLCGARLIENSIVRSESDTVCDDSLVEVIRCEYGRQDNNQANYTLRISDESERRFPTMLLKNEFDIYISLST
jgi:hypothetical protein